MEKIKKILNYLWQLPQNLLGLATFKCYPGYTINVGDNAIAKISSKMHGGITLGKYIVISHANLIKHEYGHAVQSKYLGPLYLLVIGLPSICHASVHNYLCKNPDYYHFYTEKWANQLSDKYYKQCES